MKFKSFNFALKTLEIVSALKQELYICNHKEQKVFVSKNPDRNPFR